ncbi:MAG: hypothetical protein RBU37_26790 [Myxococcota bacterium]|jgi:hypothetical protein|nr:hypothetical protein [Myxococcota bacterium]
MRYQAYFCEENIWHLCQDSRVQPFAPLVLFVSNEGGCCELYAQRLAKPGGAVRWDYHVILMTLGSAPLIWDLDSVMPFPTDAHAYLRSTFLPETPGVYRARFRLLLGEHYLRHFCSDRSHMRDGSGWLKPAPPWPPILAREGVERWWLSALLDFRRPSPGKLMELSDLLAFLALSANKKEDLLRVLGASS